MSNMVQVVPPRFLKLMNDMFHCGHRISCRHFLHMFGDKMTEVPELMPGLDVGQAMSELSPATSVGPFVPNDLTNNYIYNYI